MEWTRKIVTCVPAPPGQKIVIILLSRLEAIMMSMDMQTAIVDIVMLADMP